MNAPAPEAGSSAAPEHTSETSEERQGTINKEPESAPKSSATEASIPPAGEQQEVRQPEQEVQNIPEAKAAVQATQETAPPTEQPPPSEARPVAEKPKVVPAPIAVPKPPPEVQPTAPEEQQVVGPQPGAPAAETSQETEPTLAVFAERQRRREALFPRPNQ